MNRLEKLIKDLRKQLFPYHHEHDTVRGQERWEVEGGEYVASWLGEQLSNCRKKNRCAKRRRCAYYGYVDLATRNYEICNEVLLRIENGDIKINLEDDEEGEKAEDSK